MRATRLSKLLLKALRADSNTVATTPLTVEAVSGQTATLFEAKNSSSVRKLAVSSEGRLVPSLLPMGFITATTESTAAAVTYTAATILRGLILRDPNGSARTDVLPTAALLVAAIPNAVVGTAFVVTIRNAADASEAITMSAGSGGSISGTATIAQNNTKSFLIVLTNVTSGSEAYVAYSLGTVVH